VRRLVQLLALLLLATSSVMLVTAFTAADASGTQTSSPGVLQAAWFWKNAVEQANSPVAVTPPATEPSGVPAGDFAVAHTSQDSDSSKMTVLAFDTGALTPGSFVNSFTFKLTVDSDPQAANVDSQAAPVVACLPTRLWSPAMGGDYTDEPPVDCSTKVKPKISGSTYTFSIPQIAQDWVDDQNVGVAIVNDPDNTAPFQVDFTGAKTVKATMSWTPGTTTTGGVTGGTTSSTGGLSSGGTTPSMPDTSGSSVAAGNVPSTTTTAPDAGQAPQVATPTTTMPVAKTIAASSAPDPGFWIAGAAIALLVLLVSMVLGDATLAAQTASNSRLDRVLRGRSGSAALAGPRG